MTDSRLLVVGGRQRKKALNLDEWQAYDRGIILELDPKNGQASVVVEYESPSDVCPENLPSIVFKAGDLHPDGQHLVVCTQTEVMEFRLSDWRTTFYFSHSWFNDLHHVCYRKSKTLERDRLLIANTGLDQVIELNCNRESHQDSQISGQWSACDQATWSRFDEQIDYRRVATTKPHLSHPNFVFESADEIFATRFHQQDAVALTGSDRAIKVAQGNPHDGIVRDGMVYFTTTNGHVVECDLQLGETASILDLNRLADDDELLGWCRGICHENDEFVWVGFSRIRPTWLRKNLSWIKQGFRNRGHYGTKPTRIARYDLKQQCLVDEFDLEPYGMNAVFGVYILPVN